jgi:putative DNA primase/helicase
VNELQKFTARLDADIASRQSEASNRVILVNGSDLNPQPVRWLWPGWLALGKLHILAGAPGVGKTTVALSMAARISSGTPMPDGSPTTAGNVLIWSGEDDHSDTLLPRLVAAGADPSRCFFISGARVNGDVTSFDPARDLPELVQEVDRIGGVSLLIVDPIVSAVTGNSHQNGEVRRGLQPVVDLAAACGSAVLGITHFSKGGQGEDPTQRVIGSVAFSAVARVVLVAAKVHRDGEDVRILARSKSNIGSDEGGFEYHLEEVEPLAGIHATRVCWDRTVEGSARELLSAGDEEFSGGDAKTEASDFLRELLSDGPVPRKAVEAAAEDAGLAWRTVQRAADKSLVIKRKDGMSGGWYWQLAKMPKDASLKAWQASAPSAPSAAEEEVL